MDNISRDLGRIEGKLDSILIRMADHTDRMNRIDDNHEQLAEKVADNQKKLYAITLIGSALWGIIVHFVARFFSA